MMDPDYDIFCSIVAASSLSAAARELHLSPASISKRLARLEARLGARLIHRTTRRLVLTPVGQELHAELLPIRSALKAVEDRFNGRASVISGPLRLTAPTSFGRMHLANALHRFLAAHRNVILELDLSDTFVDLAASRYDMAIRITSRISPELAYHRIATSRRVLCASPAYLAQYGQPVSLADMAGHRLLAAVGQLPWQLDGASGSEVVEGISAVITNSSEVVRELAIAGGGIALRSLWDVAPALASGALVRILPNYEGSYDVAVYAVHLPVSRPTAMIAALIEHLQSHFLIEGNSESIMGWDWK
jgi:DNA-binding transcriptional LysR family regulator